MRKYEDETPISDTADYVARQPVEYHQKLEELRALVKSTIPEAEELIRYQVICYKYLYMLVGIGVKKNHISFYTMNPTLVKQLKTKLTEVKHAGSTLHFPLDSSLPFKLIKEVIKTRVKENERKADLKKKPK